MQQEWGTRDGGEKGRAGGGDWLSEVRSNERGVVMAHLLLFESAPV